MLSITIKYNSPERPTPKYFNCDIPLTANTNELNNIIFQQFSIDPLEQILIYYPNTSSPTGILLRDNDVISKILPPNSTINLKKRTIIQVLFIYDD